MKKADLFLGIGILCFSVFFFIFRWLSPEDASFVTVKKDGVSYGTYSLEQDQEIPIGTTNTIQIKNHSVTMVQSDCPDHLCEKQGTISKNGEMIVCLPNRITVQIDARQSDDQNDVDAIAGSAFHKEN